MEYRVFQPASPPVGFIGRSPADSIPTDITMGQLDEGGIMTQPKFVLPASLTFLPNISQCRVPLGQSPGPNNLCRIRQHYR